MKNKIYALKFKNYINKKKKNPPHNKISKQTRMKNPQTPITHI